MGVKCGWLGLAAFLLGCGTTVTPIAPGDGGAGSDAGEAVDGAAPDVSTPPVDVPPAVDQGPPGALELREPCTADRECASGVCVRGPGLEGGCSLACVRDTDCAAVSGNYTCAVERLAEGGRLTCARVPNAEVEAPSACERDEQCVSNLCVDNLCRNACGADSECLPGWRCGPFPVGARTVQVCRANPISAVTVEEYTLFQGDTRVDLGTPPLRVVSPPDAVSLTWITQDLAGRELFAAVSRVVDPNDEALVDLRTFSYLREQAIRTVPGRQQINVALLPSSDTLTPIPGIYSSSHALLTNREAPPVTQRAMRALVRIKRAPGGMPANGWVLRLRVVFVGLTNINAAAAASNRRLQAALTQMQAIYAQVGIGVTVVGYHDIAPADAQRLSVIDSQEELRDLLTRSAPYTGDVLTVFLVRGISPSAGLEGAIGVAGAIAGPPSIPGTIQSGVVAGWETTFGGGRDVLPNTLSHECGHFLGLWHTRERMAPCTQPAQMECSPFGGVDPISDTPTPDNLAQRNVMYWSSSGSTVLTAGQGHVLRRNPLVR